MAFGLAVAGVFATYNAAVGGTLSDTLRAWLWAPAVC
jgi:hypothetical protein